MSYASSLLYFHMIYWSSCKRNLAVCNELQVSSISSTSISESREMLYFSSSREWRTSEHILHKVLSKPFTKLMLQTLHNCPFEKIFSISTYVFLSFEWFIAIRLCLTVKKKKKKQVYLSVYSNYLHHRNVHTYSMYNCCFIFMCCWQVHRDGNPRWKSCDLDIYLCGVRESKAIINFLRCFSVHARNGQILKKSLDKNCSHSASRAMKHDTLT